MFDSAISAEHSKKLTTCLFRRRNLLQSCVKKTHAYQPKLEIIDVYAMWFHGAILAISHSKMACEYLLLDDFSKFANVEYRTFLFQPFCGKVAKVVRQEALLTELVLQGADKMYIPVAIKMTKSNENRTKFFEGQRLLIANFGLEQSPLKLVVESLNSIKETKNNSSELSDISPYVNNPSLCSAVLIFDDFRYKTGKFYLCCTDAVRNLVVFKAYSSSTADAFAKLCFKSKLSQGHIIKVVSFSIVPLSGLGLEFRLTEDTSISVFGKGAKMTFSIKTQ
ncbi:hypothetical protein L596_020429 [Steinernema carpocapsae]|uniref:Uncharacterized protein n=1 Tax=Steinernema carpocapsae TaxID=34508 RepID=A0A4U5MTP4_STECR|nr:hypothetical protein L596_020429 [Steinernema carpocapsae]